MIARAGLVFFRFHDASNMTNSGYRPEIDGLRAIAVMGVVLYHAGLGVSGGYVGVDVFFVISGYLITGIILRAQEADRFSVLEFFERRLRRIFPALFVMILVTLGVSAWVMVPNDFDDVGRSAIAQALFVANVFFWQDTNYFAGPAELKPLLHTWSLAVEEQFYFFLPALLVVLKNRSRCYVFRILLVATLISFSASLYGVVHYTGATFFLLPTRAWELCFGCLLATFNAQAVSRPKRDGLIAAAGLISIVASMLLLDRRTVFPGLAALPSVAGATAVIYATFATKNCFIARLLAFRPLVFVGLISYSLYLWHWPVLVFLRYSGVSLSSSNVGPVLGGIFTISVLSWRLVEQPFRSQRFLKRRRAVFLCSFVMIFISIGLATGVVYTDGMKGRFQGDLAQLVDDTEWRGGEYRYREGLPIRRGVLPVLGLPSSDAERLDFVLWGDSHGMVMSALFDDIATQLKLSGVVIARQGRAPLPNVWNVADSTKAKIDKQRALGDKIVAFLIKERPRHLFLVCRWSAKCEGMSAVERAADSVGGRFAGMVVDSEVADATPENSARAIERQLANLIRYCEGVQTTVWVVRQVPESGVAQPARDLVLRRMGINRKTRGQRGSITEHDVRQRLPDQIFDSLAADLPKLRFLDPAPWFFDANGVHQEQLKGRSFYRDDDHLTRWGLEQLRPLLQDSLTEVRRQTARTLD